MQSLLKCHIPIATPCGTSFNSDPNPDLPSFTSVTLDDDDKSSVSSNLSEVDLQFVYERLHGLLGAQDVQSTPDIHTPVPGRTCQLDLPRTPQGTRSPMHIANTTGKKKAKESVPAPRPVHGRLPLETEEAAEKSLVFHSEHSSQPSLPFLLWRIKLMTACLKLRLQTLRDDI
eukprot:m.185878 g.185878  ORF g.185878 m.185878 type:complete len:173 (+) comp25573_c2_seq3:1340-1858(+)